ncbi:MAG: hydrogenase 4 subunit B [Rhodospirillales bacterium]|nr:hydrogenase 4 subunit B [Rhodospirillales bacterium]
MSLLAGIGLLLALSVLALFVGARPAGTPLVYAIGLVLSLFLLAVSGSALLRAGPAQTLVLPLGLPWIGTHLRLDALAAFFLVVINLGGAGACLYGIGYGRHAAEPLRVLPLVPAFLAGMNLVPLADDAFTFLVAWEFMSLASWALVVAEHRGAGHVEAGYIYLAMAVLGTFALLLAFGLLAGPAGDYAFASMRAAHAAPPVAAVVLGLVLFGAGAKAGLVPMHVWLPRAHPVAPSHVSALMSGVMTKVAIYAVIRIVFDLLGPPAWWWGLVVMGFGGASALMGILYALFETDLKRVLAYSTIENVGFVFAGLGLALAFRADGMAAAAALALTAALLHVLNHAVLKSLQFFGAGAVLGASGLRDMDRMGGLIHRMKVTSVAMLAGAIGLSALPPFNAFVSEWLTFQAILLSPALPQWGLKLLVPAVGALLALAAALAATCFVRLYGIVFLGRPRSDAAAAAHETDPFSATAMVIFAGLALLLGIVPGPALGALRPAVASVLGTLQPAALRLPWLSIAPLAASRGTYNGLLVFLFIAGSAALVAVAIRLVAPGRTRRGPAWDCGFPDPSPSLQYSAGGFAEPIRRVFGPVLFRSRTSVHMPPPGETRPARLVVRSHDVVWEVLYAPVAGLVAAASSRLNVMQFLTIRRYLSLVFALLVILLLVLALWR